jgi:hypothetical protein
MESNNKAIRRLKRHLPCLQVLATSKPSLQKAILCKCDKDLIYCICECAYNFLGKSSVPYPRKTINGLKKHKRLLRLLADKRVQLAKKKKQLVNQSGGFLPTLLVPLLTFVASIIADRVIDRK